MSLTKSVKSIIRYVKKSSVWVKLIILCICVLLLVKLFKRMENRVEGFEDKDQNTYIKKKDLYDKFYSESMTSLFTILKKMNMKFQIF